MIHLWPHLVSSAVFGLGGIHFTVPKVPNMNDKKLGKWTSAYYRSDK